VLDTKSPKYLEMAQGHISLSATRSEKTIYSRVTTVGPDPHGEVPDPCTYRPDPRARSRTSTGVPGPPCAGSGPCTVRSQDRTCTGPWAGLGGGSVTTRVRTQSGVDLSACATAPGLGGDPMLPRGLLRVA
jgi:hypothetical protein